MSTRPTLRSEMGPLIRLAVPLAIGELGWMMMSVVDTIMVGRLPDSALAIGATSLGTGVFYTVGIFGSGLLLGLDTLASQAFGRGDTDDCNHSLFQALYVAAAVAPILMIVMWFAPAMLRAVGIDADLVQQTSIFLRALDWSLPPLLLYFALRRYLQAIHRVRIVMITLVSANIINFGFNWLFMYSRWMGGHGVAGSGWSTVVARIYMAVVLASAVLFYNARLHLRMSSTDFRVDLERIKSLLKLGLPAATQILFEIAAFTAAAVLAGRLGALPLAAHQIALNCAATSYMVPLGISAATAVRTGTAWGRRKPFEAHRAGHAGIVLGCSFMALCAVAFLVFPRALARIFSPDPIVVAAGARLLLVAAAFQLFDGLQIVMTGGLRGIGNTRLPMLANLGGYWMIGLPIGWWLGFHAGFGVFGIWIGLCVGLIAISLVLFCAWELRFRRSGHAQLAVAPH